MINNIPVQPVRPRTVAELNKITTIRTIKRLLWLYFYLVIFEGALRKWILPSLSGPLVLIRDPVVIMLYFLAIRARVFPRNMFILVGSVLAYATLVVGMIVLRDSVGVPLYGFHADFLHLPVIFLMAKVFDADDVQKMGRMFLMIAPAEALLMVVQFKSSPEAFINAGAGEGAKQLTLVGDHIRAAGTFSYISGPCIFFPTVAAFIFDGYFQPGRYPRWLLIVSAVSVGIAVAVSGSRTLLGTVIVEVVYMLFVGIVLKPRLLPRTAQILGAMLIVGLLLTQTSIFNEGTDIFSKRIASASKAEGGVQGILNSRILSTYTLPFEQLSDVPFWGNGLGMGTIGGATLLTGKKEFLLSEGEWSRVMLEGGPILGTSFIAFRVALVLWLAGISISYARKRSPLPFLLLGAIAMDLLQGKMDQPSTLGFLALVGGLCISATQAGASEMQSRKLPQLRPRGLAYTRQPYRSPELPQ